MAVQVATPVTGDAAPLQRQVKNVVEDAAIGIDLIWASLSMSSIVRLTRHSHHFGTVWRYEKTSFSGTLQALFAAPFQAHFRRCLRRR